MTPAMMNGATNGRVQSPTNGSKLSQGVSKQKAPSNRARSPVNDAERPWSPRSGAPSQGQSRATQKSSRGTETGTKYPPLPESRLDSRAEEQRESELGPLPPFTPGKSKSQGGHGLSRAPSKASTLAPSDSPSVAALKYYKKKAALLEQELHDKEQTTATLMKSPRSPAQPVPNPMSPKSPTIRAMSPRQNVTQEDFMQVASALSPRMIPQTNVTVTVTVTSAVRTVISTTVTRNRPPSSPVRSHKSTKSLTRKKKRWSGRSCHELPEHRWLPPLSNPMSRSPFGA
jgi:hypothetical protein